MDSIPYTPNSQIRLWNHMHGRWSRYHWGSWSYSLWLLPLHVISISNVSNHYSYPSTSTLVPMTKENDGGHQVPTTSACCSKPAFTGGLGMMPGIEPTTSPIKRLKPLFIPHHKYNGALDERKWRRSPGPNHLSLLFKAGFYWWPGHDALQHPPSARHSN